MVERLKIFSKLQGRDVIHSESNGTDGVRVSSSGWVSPHYSQSCAVDLDPAALQANRCVGLISDASESDYYKVLRIQLRQRLKERRWNSVMVTSVHGGEGKTVTAINLAAMFAKEFDQTVLLVDCDLCRQPIQHYLGYRHDFGLVDHVMEGCPLDQIIVWPKVEKLTLISGGRTVADATELLTSPRMAELVREMKDRYTDRLIFFDLPPLLGSADALSFAPLVDGIVVVVEEGRTPMPDINKALKMLPEEKIMGLVLNKGSEKTRR